MIAPRINGLTIAAVAFLLFLIYQALLDGLDLKSTTTSGATIPSASGAAPGSVLAAASPGIANGDAGFDPLAVAAPYPEYTLTQGPHGFSYGHMAIDLTAGKGAIIHSPINGRVTDKFIDEYGNTTLVIENERFQVTLLHGKYSPAINDRVHLGDPIGLESNKGYTLDRNGNPCNGRDCGYHTHLNIYDKQVEVNVNPLDLISP